MKFNESIDQKTQLAAAALQQEAPLQIRANQAAPGGKLGSHQELSDITMASQMLPLQGSVARDAGCHMHDRMLRLPEVLKMVGIGRTSLYEMVKSGKFPAPLHLSVRTRAWRLSAILDFIASVEGGQ